MTRQPAIQLRVHLAVAVDAKPHLEIQRPQPVHGFYISVTLDTIQAGPFDMGDVIEKDEIRDPVGTDPRYGFFLPVMFLLLNDLGMVRNNVLMAEEALFQGRDPGMSRSFHKGMAEAAVNLLHPGMNAVAEINRLLRAKPSLGIIIEEVEQGGKE